LVGCSDSADFSKFKAATNMAWRDAAQRLSSHGRERILTSGRKDVKTILVVPRLELLRELKERALAEILAVGEPRGDVEGSARSALVTVRCKKKVRETVFGDVERRAVAVRFRAGCRRDERKFRGAQWSSLPVSARV